MNVDLRPLYFRKEMFCALSLTKMNIYVLKV